jgi:CelD/BcsL family acetyltransferase involved in cellulose biosynthesis
MVIKLETLTERVEPSLQVFDRLSDARADWIALCETATVSPYQNYDFVAAWSETIGRARRLTPMIVVARGADGRPLALFPLATRAAAGFRVAEFLCGRESNFNIALLHPDAGLDARGLLLAAASGIPRPPDLLFLRNQPRRLGAIENPLLGRDSRASPSFAYGAALPARADALDQRVSKASRKKLRKKEKRLTELGALVLEHRANGARAREIIAALIAQKTARLAPLGASGVFEAPEMRAFIERARDAGVIEIHALRLSGRIIATYVGLAMDGRFSALANSYDMDSEIARCSPGDILLHALLRNLVERGFASFDLGVGEARYKEAVCDETIELFDLVIPVTPRGALAAPVLRAFLDGKRLVKQTPWLSRLLGNARLSGMLRRFLAAT